MTFSNVSVFRNTVNTLNTSGSNKVADQIKKGGAFAPTTFESVALMRSDLDNSWDNSYIIKYQALMQNRLNRLKQDITNSYKSLLEASSVQQIRQQGLNSSNSSVTDVYGNLLKNSDQAFKKLDYYEDNAAFTADDGKNGTSKDGVPSHLVNTTLTEYNTDGTVNNTRAGGYEMRNLYVNGPALSIVNDMKVAIRTEEVPSKKQKVNLLGIDIGSLLGAKPFTGGEKVAEYSAEVKAGGYFSTVNYLYNFAPRELKYQYATAYSTTTEEVGTRQDGGIQATLFNQKATDARDANPGGAEDDPVGPFGNGASGQPAKPTDGARIKWGSSNPSDGYITEKSAQFDDIAGNGTPSDKRLITRRTTDNDGSFIHLKDTFAEADSVVKDTWTGFTDTTASSGGEFSQGTGEKQITYGTEEFGSGNLTDRIKWEYSHDGIASADLNRDGKINNNDTHSAKAIFINHYIVETQEVEMNSSSASWGGIQAGDTTDATGKKTKRFKEIRSAGLDGSAEHIINNVVKTPDDGITRIDQVDQDGNGDLSDDKDTNEKLLLSGSGKISKSFNGDYISKQYQIKSFNGQNIATNSANVNISSENNSGDPVVIAEYEGFKRAQTMSSGVAHDYFSDFTTGVLSRTQAIALARKYAIEVNASQLVDTDWHYSNYDNAAKDSIAFRNLKAISYIDNGIPGTIPVDFNPGIRDNLNTPAESFDNVTVGFRKVFKLEGLDFQDANFPIMTDKDIYINTPTYTPKDVFVKVTTNGANGDLIVNGKLVPAVSAGVYNLKGYLNTGDNVMAYQTDFNGNGSTDEFKIESNGIAGANSNTKTIDRWLGARVSTVRSNTGDSKLNELNDTFSNTFLSSWQSKMMVKRIVPASFASNPDPDAYKKAIDSLGSIKTVTKTKDNNSFSRILTDALNKKEFQDIFNLGLVNSALGKNMLIKAQVSAPTGGNLNATMEIRYDPVNNKWVLVQNKFDAMG